ncbi:MAG: arsenate reductase ArsC [Promethearchaeota archaeon]
MNKLKLIFLCSGNSARSQMAEAITKNLVGDKLDVYSAGFEPLGINPYAKQVIEELGIDMSNQVSKKLNELDETHFDIVITLCSHAEKVCPTIPGIKEILYWPFEDPVVFEGSEEEKLKKFREIRDLIKEKIISYLKTKEIL